MIAEVSESPLTLLPARLSEYGRLGSLFLKRLTWFIVPEEADFRPDDRRPLGRVDRGRGKRVDQRQRRCSSLVSDQRIETRPAVAERLDLRNRVRRVETVRPGDSLVHRVPGARLTSRVARAVIGAPVMAEFV